jgi:replicative DNA helicase
MTNNTIGRLPPQNLDAEKSVLGSILIDSDSIVSVADILVPESFYDTGHQHIYAAMEALYEKRQPIDVVTLNNQVKKMKKLKAVGGTAAIAELSNIVSSAANVKHYAQLVAEAYVKRRMIGLSGELSQLAFDDGKDVTDIMDLAEQRVFALSQTQNKKAFLPIKDTLVESFERLDELQKNGGELRGVPTGWSSRY